MDKRNTHKFRLSEWRLAGWVMVWMLGCALWWWSGEPTATASSDQWTVPPVAPQLSNAGFECTNGFTLTQNTVGKDIWIPNGWTINFAFGSPRLLSTRMSVTGECNPNGGGHVTRQEGHDSWYFPSQDIATPPEPGKPFDLVLYQQIPATYGGEYSLSGWLASECGDNVGGAKPCPDGQYVAKLIGIDPNGGIDHTSPEIEWAENRNDRRWQNLYTSARALTNQITIFIRVISPFQFHNNKAFVDALSIVRAPLSALNPLPSTVKEIGKLEITWFGQQSSDIATISGGNYDLLFDVQTRPFPGGAWRNIVTGTDKEGSILFLAPCLNNRYQFRVRARAEQPENEDGASPNHRYPGVWSKPQTVLFTAPPVTPVTTTLELTPTLYMPVMARTTFEGC